MDLEYMKVSLFEINYNKKIFFFTIFKFSEMHLYISEVKTAIIPWSTVNDNQIEKKKKILIGGESQQKMDNVVCSLLNTIIKK